MENTIIILRQRYVSKIHELSPHSWQCGACSRPPRHTHTHTTGMHLWSILSLSWPPPHQVTVTVLSITLLFPNLCSAPPTTPPR